MSADAYAYAWWHVAERAQGETGGADAAQGRAGTLADGGVLRAEAEGPRRGTRSLVLHRASSVLARACTFASSPLRRRRSS